MDTQQFVAVNRIIRHAADSSEPKCARKGKAASGVDGKNQPSPPGSGLQVGFYSRSGYDNTTFHADAGIKALCGLQSDAPSDLSWQHHWHEGIHPDDRPNVNAELARLNTEGRFTSIYRLTGADGVERVIIDCGQLFLFPGAKVPMLLGMMLHLAPTLDVGSGKSQRVDGCEWDETTGRGEPAALLHRGEPLAFRR